ncbi:hypothetical protein LSTR_LSTR005967 [Laodelphax striatellus]|uniref:Mff-like domain-containing protein n=1 Tax=Laodelphax striatellus TaxID=195883 RepID=A0A482WEY4_LAOST|nr:hypothetical protein LSTR_LSTR005967 [Laodelphax striatellus]
MGSSLSKIDMKPSELELEARNSNAIQFWNDGVLLNRPNYAVLKTQKTRNARTVHSKSSNSQIPYLRTIRSESFLTGHEEFSGLRGPPLEASHEKAVLRPEVERVRVQTPPSTITMHEYNFPSAVDDLAGPPDFAGTPPAQGPFVVRPKGRRPYEEEGGDRLRTHEYNGYSRGGMDSRNDSFISNDRYRMQNVSQYREGTPPLTDGMSANDEIAHLRRQLAKLNRRVMSIELENLQRQQYEKIACALSVGYIVWKTLLWLRSSS